MSHPHNDLRDHKVSERRLSMFGHKRAAGGAVEHSDERADKALVKSMVKGASLKAAGGKVKARADRPCRARGGKVKKGKGTNVNVIIAPQGGGMPPGPPPGMAMKPPMAPPPGPMPGGPPPGAPPMMPHKTGGRAYKNGGRVKRADGGQTAAPPQRDPYEERASITTDTGTKIGSGMRPGNPTYNSSTGKVKGLKTGGRVKRAWGGAMPGAFGGRAGLFGAPQGGPMSGGMGLAPQGPQTGMGLAPQGPVGGPMSGGMGLAPQGPVSSGPAGMMNTASGMPGPVGAGPVGSPLAPQGPVGAGPIGSPLAPDGPVGAGPQTGMGLAPQGPVGAGPVGSPLAPRGPTNTGATAFKRGGAVKSGNTWKEGVRDGTQVQHNDSGKTADQKDGVPSRKGMRVVTFWAGGAVKRKTGGPVFANGKAGAQMAPKLPAGAGGGEGRLAKRKLAYGKPAREVNGAR